MANPIRGEVAFEAEGEAYTLVYSVNALCDLEALLAPKKTAELLSMLSGGGDMAVTRAFMWAGLKKGHDLSLIEAGDVVSALGPVPATQVMLEALGAAFPRAEGGEGAHPRKRASPGTSKSSSRSG